MTHPLSIFYQLHKGGQPLGMILYKSAKHKRLPSDDKWGISL